MWVYDKKEKVKDNLKTYMDMSKFPKIEGYNFENDFKANDFFKKFINMGFQGSNLGIALNHFENMIREKREKKTKIFMAFTGNMISSGNRELITFLVKNKLLDGIVTTAAGIEEDIIKTKDAMHLGSFDVKGSVLLDECVGRIGNIFVPADRYLYLERFLNDIFDIASKIQKERKHPLAPYEINKEIGKLIETHEYTKENAKESYLYWAYKNNIPVFAPTITDGAIGDISVFYKRKNKEFTIDITAENYQLTKIMMETQHASSVILGGGSAKHFLLNAAIFRDGFEDVIYVSTAQSFDGSDSGGNQEEAISWAKIKPDAHKVKVFCDATIAFPIIMANTFAN